MDRYEEAMSRCKQWEREHTKGYVIQDMIEFIFPELANEDEKIKRAISYAIAQVKHEDGILIDRITEDMALAWLEKQKEQKPAEWSEEDSRILYNVIAYVGYAAWQRGVKDDEFKEANSWLKSFPERFNPQPKQEWSEEDERICKGLKELIPQCMTAQGYNRYYNWLKNLHNRIHPQPHWKPSEEQIKVMQKAVMYFGDSWVSKDQKTLESLYADLKKLM